jgi:hypothetical protein
MEEKARTLDLRLLVVATAVVAIALTVWAAGAFAAGGSSGSSDSPAGDTPAWFVQAQDDGQQQAPSDDCPDGAGGGSDGGGSGSDQGSGSRSLLALEVFEAREDLAVARRDEAGVLDERAGPGERELVRRIRDRDDGEAAGEAERERPEQAGGRRGEQTEGFGIRVELLEVDVRHPALLGEEPHEVVARDEFLLDQDLAQPAPPAGRFLECPREVCRRHEPRLDDERAEWLRARLELRKPSEERIAAVDYSETGA